MIFSTDQLSELLGILDRFHISFISTELGTNILSKEDKRILREAGVNLDQLKKEGKMDDAFRFGMLADSLKDKRVKNMSYEQYQKFVKSGKFLPLTENEQAALNAVKTQTYSDIKGLGNRIGKDITTTLVEVDKTKRQKYEKVIAKEGQEAILNKNTLKEFSSALGHKTKDWARDFDRIADYVMHDAFDRGKAYSILKRVGGDAIVYKEVYPGACEHCIDLYLTNGIGSRPILFKLDTILANGTNIGRKVSEWKPVLGPTHPFCRCELMEKPSDHAFNPVTKEFEVKRKTYGVKRKSKVSVIITEE